MNPKSMIKWAAVIALLLLVSGGGAAVAGPDTSSEADETDVDAVTSATPHAGGLRYSLSAETIYQARADLEKGGSFRKAQYALGLGVGRAVTDSLDVDIDLKYQVHDYEFYGTSSSLASAPWDTVHETGIGAGVRYKLSENWSLMGRPSATFARESGARWSDAIVFGGFAAVSGYPRKDLMLGFGLGVFTGLENTDVFPVLFFSWEITERLRLGNPMPSGPASPAGLELAYTPGEDWGYALGAGYRSNRFRLDRSGVAPDGIGEERGVPVWLKVSRTMGKATASLYAGAVVNGELTLEDRHGREIVSRDYDPAPLLALTLSARF